MAGRIKTVVGLLSELLDNPKMAQTGRLQEYSNATSKDPDKILEDWMRPNQVVVDPIEYPVVNLSDFEGRGYVLGESDRAIANRRLEGIGNKALSSPIDLNTGSNFMFHNPEVWSSGQTVISKMMNQAKVLKEQTGKNPIMLPRLLGPQGVDFDKNLMTAMLRWNVANAPKSTLKQQDVILKDVIPGWRGATDPQSMEAFYNLPADTRKATQIKLDKLKNEGGLSIGNARVALTNPDYIDVPNQTLPAVAEIDVDKGMTKNTSLNYQAGLLGKGIGLLSEPLTAPQLVSPSGVLSWGDKGLVRPQDAHLFFQRANTSGILDRAKLNALSDAGVKFKSAAIPGIATALVGASSLYSSDSDAGVVSSTLNAARKIGDDYTSLLDSAAAKQPMDSAILPGQGGQTFVKPDQEATARMYDEFRNQINSVGENVFDSSPISGAVEIGGREGVKGISRYTFPREYAGETSKIGVDSPDIIEFASDETGARLFREKLMEGKDASKYGSSVTAYDADEYKGMRLFLSEDGSTGYALKPDGDIVSAFSAGKYEGVGPHLIMHGIEQGGKKLDAFDTVLPDLYAQMGFKEAARVKFDPAEAPDDWNMLTYKKFNEGQPDISLMSLDDAPATPVSPNMVDDYGTALDLQSRALAEANGSPLTAFSDKGNKWLQKLLAEAEQADLPQSAIDQGYSPSILQHVGEPGLQGYDLNAAAVANENSVSGMYNYPTKRESDRYLDQMQRYRDKSLEQYETVTRGDKAFVIGGDTPTPEMEQQFLSELEDAFKVKYSELPEHKQGWFDEKVDQFLRYGDLTASPLSRDAKNRIYRAGGADVLVRNGREIVSLKPEQVRSPQAKFNIDDQGSNNFMASVAGAGVLGALALPQNSQAEEYTEAPVIDEQSFGSMVQEYGDINRRAKAADDQKFGLLMADRSDRAGMSRRDRRGSPASPELQEFTRANALPSLLQFASGVGEGGVDYLKDTFSGGGYVTAPAYASQQYEDINRAAMMAPEEARAPLRADQIYLDPRMAEEAERLNAAGRGFAGILSMFSPI